MHSSDAPCVKMYLIAAVASRFPFGPKRGSVPPAGAGLAAFATLSAAGSILRFRRAVRPTDNPPSDDAIAPCCWPLPTTQRKGPARERMSTSTSAHSSIASTVKLSSKQASKPTGQPSRRTDRQTDRQAERKDRQPDNQPNPAQPMPSHPSAAQPARQPRPAGGQAGKQASEQMLAGGKAACLDVVLAEAGLRHAYSMPDAS